MKKLQHKRTIPTKRSPFKMAESYDEDKFLVDDELHTIINKPESEDDGDEDTSITSVDDDEHLYDLGDDSEDVDSTDLDTPSAEDDESSEEEEGSEEESSDEEEPSEEEPSDDDESSEEDEEGSEEDEEPSDDDESSEEDEEPSDDESSEEDEEPSEEEGSEEDEEPSDDDDDEDEDEEDLDESVFLDELEEEDEIDLTDLDLEESYVNEKDLETLFENDQTLSDSFRGKAVILFDSAVANKVKAEKTKLQNEFYTQLNEAIESRVDVLVEKVDTFLTHAVELWMESNKLAVEEGLRNEFTEDFIGKLKNLFVENYIEVPTSKRNIMNEMKTALKASKDALCEARAEAKQYAEELVTLQRSQVLAEASAELSDTQRARLEALTRDIEFVNPRAFLKKVKTLKECYFQKVNPTKPIMTELEVLSESVASKKPIVEKQPVNNEIEKINETLSRMSRASTFNPNPIN